MTEAKCNFRKSNSNVNCVACSIKGKYNEETQEGIFNSEYLSTNKTGEDFSEIFDNYWNTEKVLVNFVMINMIAKKMENTKKHNTNPELNTRKHLKFKSHL